METPVNPTRPQPPVAEGLSPRRWMMIGLAVVLFGLIFYYRLNQTPRDQINALPTNVAIEQLDRRVPEFTLTDTSGKPVTQADLIGRPTLYYFFFSTCPGICPIMNKNAEKLRDRLPKETPLRIVGISVNPETDTPEVLARYGLRFKVDPRNWLMLTGEREKIFDLSSKGFLLAAVPADPQDIPTNGPVIHSPKMVLVDRQGKIVQYFDGLEEDFPQKVEKALKVLSLDY